MPTRGSFATCRAPLARGLIGTPSNVLVEKEGFGRTPCFAPVRFEGRGEPGDILRILITGHDGCVLSGEAGQNRAVMLA